MDYKTKLVIMCKVSTHGPFKKNVTLPIEYESKEKLIKDFMRMVVLFYKKKDYNYGRESYFDFIGLRFEASDYYYIDSTLGVMKSPPKVVTLDEWFDKSKEYIRMYNYRRLKK